MLGSAMDSSDQTLAQSYCLCGQPYDPNIFMIQCDICRDWFHGSCCNFQEHIAIEIDKYHCPRCSPVYGSSIYKPYRNWHRHDYWDEDATSKPVQTGTPIFIRELRTRHFAKEDQIIIQMKGHQLTEAYLQQKGFQTPIVVEGRDGLDMVMPPDSFNVSDVECYIGGGMDMDVIDVARQSDVRMKLRDFVAYFNNVNRIRVFNVVSMEFSNTGLSKMVEAPKVAARLDWVNILWPRDYNGRPKPAVQKYCLMSVKDSYTDFHIDFGGTSVWYHVLSGEKVFYLIRPTPANLTLYLQWMTSSNQSERFFGDQVDECFKCTLRQGFTMFIPTGWIHAVLTPVDSLVFGGNFLHSLNIPMQLQVYDIEKKIKTAEKFLYPAFETIHWFAAQALLRQMTILNKEEKKCPALLLSGLKAILPYLKQWNADKDVRDSMKYTTHSKDQIPTTINVPKLIKDISKEIRHAERYLNQLNPPKPERESKRKRKKPVNKDFVDYSLTTKSMEYISIPDDIIVETTKSSQSKRKRLLLQHQQQQQQQQQQQELMQVQQEVQVLERELTQEDILNAPMDFGWSPDLLQEEVERNAQVAVSAVHTGGTVLKIKLGGKDIVPLETEDMLENIPKSIYDFHDDSEKEEDSFKLSIDESPKKKKPIKMKLQTTWCVKSKKNKSDQNQSEIELATLPQNGIESLLKASALTTKLDASTGSTSPSTTDAIAGMLSIGQTLIPSSPLAQSTASSATSSPSASSLLATPGRKRLRVSSVTAAQRLNPMTSSGSPMAAAAMAAIISKSPLTMTSPTMSRPMPRPRRLAVVHESMNDVDGVTALVGLEGETAAALMEVVEMDTIMTEPSATDDDVHQDEDYIYPSLDNSDEDDVHIFKPRGRSKVDEAWNPKARVGPLLPKMNRPAREGTRKQAVEKVLEAAAAKRAVDCSPSDKTEKRQYKKKKSISPKEKVVKVVKQAQPVGEVPEQVSVEDSSVALPLQVPLIQGNLNNKPKKGMKTAKQRLGKILKIHKMIH